MKDQNKVAEIDTKILLDETKLIEESLNAQERIDINVNLTKLRQTRYKYLTKSMRNI